VLRVHCHHPTKIDFIHIHNEKHRIKDQGIHRGLVVLHSLHSMPLSSTTNGVPQEQRAVRFAAESDEGGTRALPAQDNEDDGDERASPSINRHQRRPRTERPNEDEIDDVDDWKGDEDEDEERTRDSLSKAGTSEHELLEAKRSRRLKRKVGQAGDEAETDTHIDNTTSLAAEGIEIEPFHMKQERSDGSGFFDGDTYVFRKRDTEAEPDAWLENLSDSKEAFAENTRSEDDSSKASSSDDADILSSEELYAKIIPLVSDTETVMQALVRYGNLIKRKPFKRNKGSKATVKDSSSPADDTAAIEATQMAQTALNDLTEAANALLLKGQVDIYQKTRNDLIQLLPEDDAGGDEQEAIDKPVVQWEYEGSQDKQIHGPYATAHMRGWIQSGYFVGPSAVKVRTVSEKEKSLQEDLLADLMEGDDNDDQDNSVKERGEWMISDQVDFNMYS
jgi:CD2 antigen cytoplasmic tail-binding protein 2